MSDDSSKVRQFRKKPVAIEATQWFKNGDHPLDGDVMFPFGEDYEGQLVRRFRRPDIAGDKACAHCNQIMHVHGWIDTLEGGHIVCPGDWIITGVKGENYPCKPEIFAATYEPSQTLPKSPPLAVGPRADEDHGSNNDDLLREAWDATTGGRRPAMDDLRAFAMRLKERDGYHWPAANVLDAADKIDALQAVVNELVALKNLHDRIDAADLSLYSIADAERANDMQAEYERRKPLAWEAARRLATPPADKPA